MSFDFSYPTRLPSSAGWGPGYPTCQTDKMVAHPIFVPSVHRHIKELVDLLVAECKKRGYKFETPGCWGFGCRGTKDSSGGQSTTPSFHSWGLALDFNAPQNPFGGSAAQSDIATNHKWIVGLMKEYGFFWLGPSIGDWMHFSFCGNPEDATQMLKKAKRNGLGQPKVTYSVAGKTFKNAATAFGYLKDKLASAKHTAGLLIKKIIK